MAAPTLSLLGLVANDCDDGSGDFGLNTNQEIFVQGTGAVGSKVSATTATFSTTTIASGPYDFSSGGAQEGDHIVMWFDALNPANGFGIYLEEGSDNGRWDLPLPSGYTGGFVPLIVDPSSDFDAVSGAWSVGGNPTQLDNVTGIGGYFDIAGSIMGNFDNALLDQITIGTGIRIEDGDGTTPCDWDEIQNYDEGTNQYGWVRLLVGAYIVQGKVRVGPASGDNDCTWVEADKQVTFLAVPVAVGFHEIAVEQPGAGTTSFTQSGMLIAAENAATARWSLTVDDSTFSETNSTYQGFDTLTLGANTTLTSVQLLDGQSIVQNGAALDGCTIRNAATADGVALIESDDPASISNCSFAFSDGHAIEITAPGTYSFVGNVFTGYGSDGTNDAAIYNNSGGSVTLNVSGGGNTPTVRNGAGASTTINSNVSVTVTPIVVGSEVRVYRTSDNAELDGVESAAGTSQVLSIPSGTGCYIVVLSTDPPRVPVRREGLSFSVDQNFDPGQTVDRNFLDP